MKQKRKPRFTTEELEQHIANRIIQMMEADGLNWIKSWIGNSAARNALTGHEYSGSNIFMTSFWMMDNECDDPRFVTKKQIDTRGGVIKKGEKGTPIFFYGTGEKKQEEKTHDTLPEHPLGNGSASASVRRYRFARIWYVWNVTQVDWDEPFPDPVDLSGGDQTDRLEAVDDFCQSLGITTLISGNFTPMYVPSKDEVRMPPRSSFIAIDGASATENFYGTWLHELVHATGSEKRLNRESLNKYRSMRPFEELVAELGSAMLCREFGISAEPREGNAAYVQSWCKTIRDKPDTILKAASAASRAIDWMWQQRNGEGECLTQKTA